MTKPSPAGRLHGATTVCHSKLSTTPRFVRRRRCGLSLLELLAVVTLMGVISAAAAVRFGRDIFGDTGVRSGARTLSLAMLEAQRGAIRTGQTHGLQLYGPLNNASSWSVVRVEDDSSRTVVDGPHAIPKDYRVQVDASEVLFDFEGNGNTAFQADLFGPHRSWRISVFPLTRMIDSREVTP